jgi:glycosyltransferase involved in cell wall biosynthesis
VKFLIHSNGPNVSTGYGVQCCYLTERLTAAGHEVAVSCTYGQQGGMGLWRGVPLYPVGYEVNGNDVIHHHAMHFFGQDPKGGWIIPILDLWCLVNPRLAEFNVAGWCPVDHFPVPPDVVKFFDRNPEAVPIAMSRFGERQLFAVGLNPVYIPLAVDTNVMKPTFDINLSDGRTVTARDFLDIPEQAFVVGMVAMNKGWSRDRKGFNEAFRAFAIFHAAHPDSVLYLHAEAFGAAEGINLVELAEHAGIPKDAIRWVDQYWYRNGLSPEIMAGMYTSFDVLLAPSHGEGFCVPLIEAQACGTPVIATDFSAQTELVGAGWLVQGQPEWDPAQHASYVVPEIAHIVQQLENAYRADLNAMQPEARRFALQYDADVVFQQHWLPFLETLSSDDVLELEREPIPDTDNAVAVVVPVMQRPQNVWPLVESLIETTGQANVYFVCDPTDHEEIDAVTAAMSKSSAVHMILSKRGHTYAVKTNVAYLNTEEPWLFVCGDDVRFHPGWLEEARKLSDRFDLIGTNDTAGKVKNPDVAAGRHADHWFIRRSYVDEYGGCLEGPGVLAPEVYNHWFVDKEIVELAKARRVFTPCLASVVEHLHPAYDGREDLRQADPVYMKARESSDADHKTFLGRVPLIAMQRTSR